MVELLMQYGPALLGFYLAYLHNRAVKRIINKK